MIRDVEIQVGNGTALPANNDTGLVSLCLAKTTAALLKLLALKRIQARATTRWVAAFVEQLQQGADAAAAGGGIFMPQSALSFTVGCLLALTEIKSNGDSKFPFLSHPYSVKIAITSILIYAFVSAIEQHMIVSANAPPVNQPPNAYKVIVSCGRIASLAILVGALLGPKGVHIYVNPSQSGRKKTNRKVGNHATLTSRAEQMGSKGVHMWK